MPRARQTKASGTLSAPRSTTCHSKYVTDASKEDLKCQEVPWIFQQHTASWEPRTGPESELSPEGPRAHPLGTILDRLKAPWQIALGAHTSRWSTADAAQPASEMDSLGTPPPDCRGGFLTQGRHALPARAFHKGIMETAQPSLRLAAAPSPPERLLPMHTAAAGSQGSSRIPEPTSPARALGRARSAAASVGSPRRVCAPTRLLWKKPCSSPFLPQGRRAEPPPAAERNQS